MPSKKNVARWPVVIADLKRAIGEHADIIPVKHEFFVDYENIDLLYWDDDLGYVSFMDAIKGNLTWKPPEPSYDKILQKYPSPALMTVVAAIDTGIIYAYIGSGTWIPISANSIKKASATNDGLMSKEHFKRVEGATKVVIVDKLPDAADREPNCLYEVVTQTENRNATYDAEHGKLIFS